MYFLEDYGPVKAGRGRVARPGFGMDLYVYYVDGLLIDTGPAVLEAALARFLQGLPPLRQVVLTHFHEDHCGGAASLARERGVPIAVHPDFVAVDEETLRLPYYRRALCGLPRPFPAVAAGDTVATENFTFHVLPAPGHAPEHIVLHEPAQGWLFSGDLFVRPRVLTIHRQEAPLETMASLEKVLALDFQQLFCAHAGLVPDGKAALKEKLQALQELQGQVEELARRGWSVHQVTNHLFPGYWFKLMRWLSGGEYSQANIVRAFWPRGL